MNDDKKSVTDVHMKKTIIVALSVAVVVGGGAFFGGMKFAESKSPSRGADAGQRQFQRGVGQNGERPPGQMGQRAGMGGGFIAGEILAKDEKSLTIKMRDGGSKIIFFSGTTAISKPSEVSAESLVVGEEVTVIGKTNTDGSVTAESVQVRPVMMRPADEAKK
jgi:hypothetical protein